jgi:aminoglycoside phosphotransferase (APT) family kinase protein
MKRETETVDPVGAILAAHGVSGPWVALEATGLANRIYATDDVVLRVATDHRDAVPDAYTESVAAPAAYDAGIRTPRLLAFDNSHVLVDRPFSIWERVHGETLGKAALDDAQRTRAWQEIGHEIEKLHSRVTDCADPHGYLDTPGYELDLAPIIAQLVDAGLVDRQCAREIENLLDELEPYVSAASYEPCFVHNDLHEMNVMCTPAGHLLAILDWGDAGWGDPTLDFAAVPLDMIRAVLRGYGAESLTRLGACFEARIIWSKLHGAMEDAIDTPGTPIPLAVFRKFLESR